MSTSSVETSLTQSLTFSKSFGLFSTVVSLLVVSFGSLLCNFGDLGGIIMVVISGASDNRMSRLYLLQWSENNPSFFFVWWVLYGGCEIH